MQPQPENHLEHARMKDVDAGAPERRALLVVVTYNSFDDLPDVVASIQTFVADHPNNHVIVVENSADCRVRDYIESSVPSARVLVEVAASNDGFSHGVNLGYSIARNRWGGFDFVVLLNPDVKAAGSVVSELVNRAARHPRGDVGVWGAVLRDEARNIDRGCARRVWNRRRFFSHLTGYHDLVGALRTTPRSLSEHEIQHDQRDLAMVSGGLMCISTDVLGDGMDTLLPMYLEDQEICLRSLSKGYSVRLHPDLELLHVGGVSRKSVTSHERALRIMELVEAPVQCMLRLQGYHQVSLRVTVFLGGLARFVAAPLAAAFKTATRRGSLGSERRWMVDQRRLATWFIQWSFTGTLHRDDVSLARYLQEYSHSDRVTLRSAGKS